MGITRVAKKLVPQLRDIGAAILVANATDPQYATLSVFYSAVRGMSHFTVLNKCDMVSRSQIRPITTKLAGEVIPASMATGRGLQEIKQRLSDWRPGVKVAVVGIFNSGKTSLINALTGEANPVGDIPGTTLELTTHNYDGKVLVDTVGQVIDISKPLMVSVDLSECPNMDSKLRKCLSDDAAAIALSVESALPGLKRAVRAIIKCVASGGKVVTCGAGASGLVAMEIGGQGQETGLPIMAFTNNFATAQPVSFAKGACEDEFALAEYFARAVGEGDVCIAVSASGGTGFVYKLLELAKARGAACVAITENRDTPLGHLADIVVKSEAKPEGPSSSRVMAAHLAIGHALMLTVADMRGIDAETSIKYMLPSAVDNKRMGIK